MIPIYKDELDEIDIKINNNLLRMLSFNFHWNQLGNNEKKWIKTFVSNALFLYPLKTSEDFAIFWCF